MKLTTLYILLLVMTAMPCLQAQPNTSKGMTAREVITAMQQHLTCPWNQETVDTFKSGNADDVVTGVATCMFANMETLQKAVAAQCNLIICHEPTFYSHLDQTAALEKDPVFQKKMEYIKKHHLIIFRFHDHWHLTKPDGIYVGMVNQLGWKANQVDSSMEYFQFKEQSVGDFARMLEDRLKSYQVRIVGDPAMRFTHVALSVGAPGSSSHIQMLNSHDTELLVAGEGQEWETYQYVLDASMMGLKKSGHFHRPHPFGGGRHGILRPMAEDLYQGSAGRLYQKTVQLIPKSSDVKDMTKAVIFDMDGVLVDSEPYHLAIEKHQIELNNLPVSEEEHHRYIGVASDVMWRDIALHHALPLEVEALIEQNKAESIRFFTALEQIPLMPGIRQTLEVLYQRSLPLAVASSSFHEIIELILRRTGLRPYFQQVVSSQEAGRSKPDPDVFLLAAHRLGVAPADCLVVEDSFNGIKAAKAAGMRCIAFAGPGANPEAQKQADRHINHFDQLIALL